MKQPKFSITKRLKSFKYAFNGLKILFREEHNSRIHILASIGVLIFGFVFKVTVYDWIALIFAIGFVIVMEIFNSAIENMADFVSPEKHEKIKKIKDLSVAGVLMSAITALIIGLIVFIPKVLELI